MPVLNYDKNIVYGISRTPILKNSSWILNQNIYVSDYPFDEHFINTTIKNLALSILDNVLIINFAGVFGAPSNLNDIEINHIVDVYNQNIVQFLSCVKLFSNLPVDSFLIGFSGGGVGGDNLDTSSLGYLLAKLSLAGLVEVYDKNLKEKGKRMALIAPGAFPSSMQTAVAQAPKGIVSEIVRKNSVDLKVDESKIMRLANAIKWVAAHPDQSGSKIWSAQRDDFLNLPLSKSFGLMRRLTQ